jgi:uncharacterized iron-regulated membrane protein
MAMPIWAFVFFICLTGTIATVSQEIVWLADPASRANPPAEAGPLLSFDEIVAVVNNGHPEAIIQSISRPVKSQFALTARISYPDTTTRTLYVNPYTGVIQGEAPRFDFRQFIRGLHGWLLLPWNNGYSWGWYLVCITAIPMLVSLITGLVVYKRFWRGFLRPRLRFNVNARVFWGDFHRLAGIWSIPFIAIISITSIWFLLQGILQDNQISFSTAGPPIYVDRADVPQPDGISPTPPFISLDEATAAVETAFPDFQTSFVSMPGNAYAHYRIGGRSVSYPLLFENVSVNPYNARIEQTRRISDLSWLELITRSMRPLHTGDFVGLTLKLVYFFFGILLTMMVFSGMMIWTKRTFRDTAAVIRERKIKKQPNTSQIPAYALQEGEST